MGELVPEPERGLVARRDVRVSDDDRATVLDELRVHFGAGRLDLVEFEERTNAVVAARYRGELIPLLADLPELAPPKPVGPPIRERQPRTRPSWQTAGFRIHAYLSVVVSVFLLVIYAGTTLVVDSGDIPFWPVFPIAALGLTVGVHAAVLKALED